MEELLVLMRAQLLLSIHMAQSAADRGMANPVKLELLLADAGFSHKEISALLQKSPTAVAKAISRGRAGRKRPSDDGPIPEGTDE